MSAYRAPAVSAAWKWAFSQCEENDMEMPRDYTPPPVNDEPMEPVTRKRALKAYSKGDLIRYVLELEGRIDQAQQQG